MKRLALLLAGTAMPLALFAAPDITSRAVAQTPPSIEMMLEEAGLDAQALERLERAVAEAQDEARTLRERAEDFADRAATSAAQAEDARDDYESLADDPNADPDEIEAARADAEDAASQAREDAQAAAEAREAAQAAEAELKALRETFETAQREAQEIRERAAEAEREAEAAAAAAAEREAEAEREAAAEAQREAEREAEAAAEAEREAEARREAEAEREAREEREAQAEREADADREARRESRREGDGERETRRETDEPRRGEAAPSSEAPSEAAREPERERERGERRRERDAAETTRVPEPAREPSPAQAPAPEEETAAAPEPQNFGEVREGRRSRVEEGVTITEEPGARTIIQEGERLIIRQAEDERVRRTYSDVRRERRGDQEVLVAPRRGRDGDIEIVTILDADGNLLRRIRREADGTETILIDNTRRERGDRDRRGEWRDDRRDDRRADRRDDRRDDRRRGERRDDGIRFGYDGGAFSFRIDIPPPVVRMPRERYVVEYGDLYEDELAEIFSAPPVAEIYDRFTLDEVRFNPHLRDYMARVDLDTVTFDTGSWSLSPQQIEQLGRAARAMNRVIDENPNEIFLIEGHTDAIGRAIDNLSLSDRRAESVAYILTRIYDVPPENLVTQGYGEEFLKIDTQEAERRNRRVTIRRITPLIAQGPRG